MGSCSTTDVGSILSPTVAGRNYGQDDGAGAPLKRSFIHLMAVGAASRAMKICDTPGSSTQLTLVPWEHKCLANAW